MRLVIGQVEFVDLVLACTAVNSDKQAEKAQLRSEPRNLDELFSFVEQVESKASWDVRTVASVFADLREEIPVLSGFPLSSKFVELEETIDELDKEFVKRFEMLLFVVLTNKLAVSEDKAEELLKDGKTLLSALQNTDKLSKNSIWFLSQFVLFPEHLREITLSALNELKRYFESSGLRSYINEMCRREVSNITENSLNKVLNYFYGSHVLNFDSEEEFYIYLQFALPDFGTLPIKIFGKRYVVLYGDIESVTRKGFSEFSVNTVKELLKGLSDPTRFMIIKALSERPKYVDELAAFCGLSKATISHHLSYLQSLGLLEKKRESKKMYYSLKKDAISNLLALLESMFHEDGED